MQLFLIGSCLETQVIDSSVVINPPTGEYPEEGVGVGSVTGLLDESLITFRQISTESGQTRRCEVKILEHGDGYEVMHFTYYISLLMVRLLRPPESASPGVTSEVA